MVTAVLKKFVVFSSAFLGLSGGGLVLSASQFTPLIAPGTMIGDVSVGGLTKEEAQRRIRGWWDTARLETVEIEAAVPGIPKNAKWAELGLRIDDVASVEQIPLEALWDATKRIVGVHATVSTFDPVFQHDLTRLEKIDLAVRRATSNVRRASAAWNGKAVVRQYEVASAALDIASASPIVEQAFRDRATSISLPITEAPKRVPDAELNRITHVMAEFTTKFSAGNVPRSANIKLASEAIKGTILMPGEAFSFNEFLGPRTTAKGYRVAGVFVNGRLDTGVGGGICQVSTTLYNAAALADLKILKRQNHSQAVPYVPVGRDAAVSYGQLDLSFANNQEFPIALDSTYGKGVITFRILGIHNPVIKVEIERAGLSSWSRGIKYVHDGSLPFGKQKVVDSGGLAHKATTYRIVKENGKIVRREVLAVSQYPGAPRLVARNMKAKAPLIGPPAPATPVPGPTIEP